MGNNDGNPRRGGGDILSRLSPRQFAASLWAVCCRFPAVVLFVIFFSAVSFAYVEADVAGDERLWFFLFFYSAGAGVLSLALRLWDEGVSRRVVAVAVNAAAHALWLCASVYLSAIVVHDLDVTYIYSSVALCLFVVAAVFLLPFFRERDDMAMWSFSQQMAAYLAWTLLVAVVLTAGLSLLLLSFDKLFGMLVSSKAYTYVAIFCFTLLAPTLLLQQLPTSRAMHSPSACASSSFTSGVIHYLFLPLLGAYLLTLYVYAAKIVLTWQLPVGWVSSLVSWSMVGMLSLVYMLYPTRFAEGRRFDKAALRLLPLLVLPLLVLMSVGIGRRINDYGVTNARLYLVAFNLWCYAVCIGLAATRARRIWWIPASFVIIGIAISVGPQSIANTVRRSMVRTITESMSKHGCTNLPLKGNGQNWIGCLNAYEAAAMKSKLRYLRNSYDRNVVNGLVDEKSLQQTLSAAASTNGDEFIFFTSPVDTSPIDIPHGSVRMLPKVEASEVKMLEDGGVTIKVEWGEGKVATFRTDLSTLKRHAANGHARLALRSESSAVYLVESYQIQPTGSQFANTNHGYAKGILFLLREPQQKKR